MPKASQNRHMVLILRVKSGSCNILFKRLQSHFKAKLVMVFGLNPAQSFASFHPTTFDKQKLYIRFVLKIGESLGSHTKSSPLFEIIIPCGNRTIFGDLCFKLAGKLFGIKTCNFSIS